MVDLLELRRADVRDASRYERFFEDAALAAALAAPGGAATGTPRIPQWKRVYASSIAPDAAEVVVEWSPSEGFERWPVVTVFSMKAAGSRWVVVDAREETAAPAPWRSETDMRNP